MSEVSLSTQFFRATLQKSAVALTLPLALAIALVYLPEATASTPEQREGVPPRRIHGGTRVIPVQLPESMYRLDI
jgi:hypothetical protein